MSFKATELSVLAYANGFTLWHYRTEDEVMGAEGYFNAANEQLRPGDQIIVNETRPPMTSRTVFVESNIDGVVVTKPVRLW